MTAIRDVSMKGGEQKDGSLIFAVVRCNNADCRRVRVVAKWQAHPDSADIVVPTVGCQNCYMVGATLLRVERIRPEESGAAAEKAQEVSTEAETAVGRQVACAACHSRYVREHEESICPNCGSNRRISQAASAARLQVPASTKAGEQLEPCINCGTMKSPKRPCPNCQKAS